MYKIFDEVKDNLRHICIKRVNKKVEQLFKFRIKSPHALCISYECTCVFNETQIGETRRIASMKILRKS